MSNLDLYNRLREVPDEAKKEIKGGRLKGFTDINPMWRIKALTNEFGYCGVGWYAEITKQWIEPSENGEIAAFVNINLYIKVEGEWSKPIAGTGGSKFIANEKNGLYCDDECFKKAYTDAIGVATKSLGLGADVYWEQDRTKYTIPQDDVPTPTVPDQTKDVICPKCGKKVKAIQKDGFVTAPAEVLKKLGMCLACYKEAQKGAEA